MTMKKHYPFTTLLFPDYEAMSARAADWFAVEIGRVPAALVGLATGGSPASMYQRLGERRCLEPELFARLRVLKTDEWGGLAMDDPGTSEVYLQQRVVSPWGISSDRYFAWQSRPIDSLAECERVREWLFRNGPIDICVLGLGVNGHLLLNEPADYLEPGPHVAHLAESSKSHGMLRDARTAPQFGLTIGMDDILRARKILLLVSGASKAEPLRRLLEPRVTTHFPASFLWLHSLVTLMCDRHAAKLTPSLQESGLQH